MQVRKALRAEGQKPYPTHRPEIQAGLISVAGLEAAAWEKLSCSDFPSLKKTEKEDPN